MNEMQRAAEDALQRSGNDLLGRAVSLAPLRDSDLRESGHVEPAEGVRHDAAHRPYVDVIFNQVYAAAQHEGAPGPPASWAHKTELDYTTPGTGTKYLEGPLLELAARYEAVIGAAVKRVVDG